MANVRPFSTGFEMSASKDVSTTDSARFRDPASYLAQSVTALTAPRPGFFNYIKVLRRLNELPSLVHFMHASIRKGRGNAG